MNTEKIKKLFDVKNLEKLKEKKHEEKVRKASIVLIIVAGLLFLIMVGNAVEAGKTRLHNPEKIIIELTDVEALEETDRNGVHYVNVEIEVENKTKNTLSRVDFEAELLSEDGEAVSSFSGICRTNEEQTLNPGESVTYTYRLADDVLYSLDKDDVGMKYTISSAHWEDGHSYLNW